MGPFRRGDIVLELPSERHREIPTWHVHRKRLNPETSLTNLGPALSYYHKRMDVLSAGLFFIYSNNIHRARGFPRMRDTLGV
jgi:hypothetical protein